ncbi:hypothetical protein HX079_18120, partial [Myroides odoratimimus]|uniref:hypothetical protein n=1 Tax=Myroides odoratimimus TaxID=76832 RepID=UPI0025758466
MQGIGETKYFGSLELFVNQEGIAMPLKELIDFDSFINVETLDKHKIREDEYHGLTDDLKKQLIKRENVFTSFVLNLSLFNKWTKQFTLENIDVYIYDLKSIFQWNKEEEIPQSRW